MSNCSTCSPTLFVRICYHFVCSYSSILSAVPSGTPVDVRVAAVTSRSIRVVWSPPLTDQQNGLILHYVVVVVAAQTRSTITLNVSSNSTSIPDLHPSYSYSIEVAAVTISVGPFSRSVSITTPDDGEFGGSRCIG